MATVLRKCLDMAPIDPVPPGTYDFEDVRYPGNWEKIVATGTRWIRVWVRWDWAEPAQGQYNLLYLAEIDQQVIQARARGISTVLVTWHFPRWSNGTANNSGNDYEADRVKPGGGLKAFEMRVPWDQLGAGGHWGHWIDYLITRYKGYQSVALEVMNEPNLQMWPQRGGDNALAIHTKVAEMMHTAWALNAFHGYPMAILGPATADYRGNSYRGATEYVEFLTYLKAALNAINWQGHGSFIWSHHNYKDIEGMTNSGITTLYAVLYNWWRGWSQSGVTNGSNPGFFITEGGCRIEAPPNHFSRTDQDALVGAAWNWAVQNPGAAMFTNYLLHGVPGFQTGLREDFPGGAPRQVYNTFSAFPAYQ